MRAAIGGALVALEMAFTFAGTPAGIALPAVELLASTAMILALVGAPTPARLASAAALFGASLVGTSIIVAGGPSMLDRPEVDVIEGSTLPYRLDLPSGWREASWDDSEWPADRVVERVTSDAVVRVVTQLGASPATVNLDDLQQRVEADLALRGDSPVTALAVRPLREGRLVHMVGRGVAGDVHVVTALVVEPGVAHRVEAEPGGRAPWQRGVRRFRTVEEAAAARHEADIARMRALARSG